ncbi:unnamed protein product [Jaminaea pallidilutea]
MLDELAEAVDTLRIDQGPERTSTLILRSVVPGVFCAGADLRERHTMSKRDFHVWHQKLGRTFRDLANLDMPVIAALDGLALGGGLELALTADVRVAGPHARKLGLPETRHAIIPGAGGTQMLSRLIGPAKAKMLIFSGRIFDAKYARDLGIIEEVVESGRVEQGENHGVAEDYELAYRSALNMAEEFGAGGPLALRAAKAAISRGIEMDISSGWQWETACYRTLFDTQDRQEGLLAFKEKRKPVYQGV